MSERTNHRGSRIVKQTVTVKVWETNSGWQLGGREDAAGRPEMGSHILPLSIAIRLDTSLQLKALGSVPACLMFWASPSPTGTPIRALETVFLPN